MVVLCGKYQQRTFLAASLLFLIVLNFIIFIDFGKTSEALEQFDFIIRKEKDPIRSDPLKDKSMTPDEAFRTELDRIANSSDAVEFPHPLTCPRKSVLPAGDYKVAIVYHIGMLHNWKTVVRDQLETLQTCGLGNMATPLIISYSGGNHTELMDMLQEFSFLANTKSLLFVHATAVPWEGRAMGAVSEICHSSKKNNETTFVFYLHSKGTSKWRPDWKTKAHQVWSYAYSLYWRKYLEWFTIERPHLCITALLDGAETCAAQFELHPWWHYSGNFWTASCSYLSKIPSMVNLTGQLTSAGYTDAEKWIGLRMTRPWNQTLNVGLHHHNTTLAGGKGLYHYLMLPEYYAYMEDTRNRGFRATPFWLHYFNKTRGTTNKEESN
jgi:hypothetical protein